MSTQLHNKHICYYSLCGHNKYVSKVRFIIIFQIPQFVAQLLIVKVGKKTSDNDINKVKKERKIAPQ